MTDASTTAVTFSAAEVSKWRDQLATFRSSPERMGALEKLRASFSAASTEAAELLEGFLSGKLSFKELSGSFDKQTRTAWVSLGAKGPSGAMLFNQLAKHTTQVPELEAAMRAVLRAPTNDAAARVTLDAFTQYLEHSSGSEPAGAKLPVPARFRFLLSACWSLQDHERWPVAYQSAVNALVPGAAKLAAKASLSERYLTFAARSRDLRAALDVDPLTLSELIAWVASAPSSGIAEPDVPSGKTWLMSLGRQSEHWPACQKQGLIGIGWREPGDMTKYASLEGFREEHGGDAAGKLKMNASLACWQFAHDMEVGDVVYVKRGRRRIIAEGVITSGYQYVPEPVDTPFVHQRKVEWRRHGDWEVREKDFVTKSLTQITAYAGMLSDLRRALGADDDDDDGEEGDVEEDDELGEPDPYTLDDAERELFLSRSDIERLLTLLRHKKNLVLKGPPGVGKTFVARRLAALLVGQDSSRQIQGVQFHPSYSYEDFVQGLRPVESGGFARHDGPLLRFCKDALEDSQVPYVLVIDEFNRGNVSKILGELLSLLETDKRHPRYAVTLAYAHADEPPFHLPPNLHVIGTMNTADRSLALVDYALRRRFAFFELPAAYDTPRFAEELSKRGVAPKLRTRILTQMRDLNARILDDPELGRGFVIGHSYFCGSEPDCDEAWYRRILEFEIVPLLEEYWHDAPEKLGACKSMLLGA